MSTLFYSDPHFGHANIIKYCNRPFESVSEMNETLIKNYNSKVQPNDTVYILGDFAFYREPEDVTKILKRLNGIKHFVFGNHDKIMRHEKVRPFFKAMSNFEEIYVQQKAGGSQHITLCHFSMKVWNQSHRGSWQLYGHSHGTLPDDPNSLSIDVGVDSHNYFPVSFEEVKEIMSKKTWKPPVYDTAD